MKSFGIVINDIKERVMQRRYYTVKSGVGWRFLRGGVLGTVPVGGIRYVIYDLKPFQGRIRERRRVRDERGMSTEVYNRYNV